MKAVKSISIDTELLRFIEEDAAEERVSISRWIEDACRQRREDRLQEATVLRETPKPTRYRPQAPKRKAGHG